MTPSSVIQARAFSFQGESMQARHGMFAWLPGSLALVVACAGGAGPERSKVDASQRKEITEQAYVYAFPMIAAYKAMVEFNVDAKSPQYKAPFNTIANEARVFTPKDTAIVTPNSDTPYSMVQMDLRAEPIVLCVPAVEKGQFPPVNAFWSVTMYDGKTQLLVANPIDRYGINSPMLPDMKKNADGSLTIYIQKDSPGAAKQANWLPAPDGPIYMVMRLYWPKQAALDGSWKPAPIVRVD